MHHVCCWKVHVERGQYKLHELLRGRLLECGGDRLHQLPCGSDLQRAELRRCHVRGGSLRQHLKHLLGLQCWQLLQRRKGHVVLFVRRRYFPDCDGRFHVPELQRRDV